jgi:hypothetical protein
MSSHNNTQRYRKLLAEIGRLAEHATLTGALDDGEEALIRRYNACLTVLEEIGTVPSGLFSPLPSGAAFGEIAVEARLLSASLDGSEAEGEPAKQNFNWGMITSVAPFVDSETLRDMMRGMAGARGLPSLELLTSIAPFMDREHLGELIRDAMNVRAPASPRAPEAPEAPEAPARRDSAPVRTEAGELENLAMQLAKPDLEPGERSELAMRLAEIAHRQALSAQNGA